MEETHRFVCSKLLIALKVPLTKCNYSDRWIKRECIPNEHTEYPHIDIYQPKLDIAIRMPEDKKEDISKQDFEIKMNSSYNTLISKWRRIIKYWLQNFKENVESIGKEEQWETKPYVSTNIDPFLTPPAGYYEGRARVCIGVECENSDSTCKRKLGSILNASLLSRIGLIVTKDPDIRTNKDPDIRTKMIKLWQYLYHQAYVRQRGHIINNLIILTQKDFFDGIKQFKIKSIDK